MVTDICRWRPLGQDTRGHIQRGRAAFPRKLSSLFKCIRLRKAAVLSLFNSQFQAAQPGRLPGNIAGAAVLIGPEVSLMTFKKDSFCLGWLHTACLCSLSCPRPAFPALSFLLVSTATLTHPTLSLSC